MQPPSDHVGLGCLDTMLPAPTPTHALQFFHLWEVGGWGLGAKQSPPPFPFLGHWPFKPAGCQGLSWSDPKGRVWSGTRGPFNCCCRLRAAHGLACWPGVVRGGDWPGPGERDQGLRQTETETHMGRLIAWAASLATLVPLHQGFEAGLLPARLQPRLDPAEPGTCSPAPKLSRPKEGY